MPVINVTKSYPQTYPLSESFRINVPDEASSYQTLIASLSADVDDYDSEQTSNPPGWIISAKKSYQDRYRTARKAEKRLSKVENELEILRNELEILKNDKEKNENILIRSQFYKELLSVLQSQLFSSLPDNLQKSLKRIGWVDLSQAFVIWWNAWNARYPITFPLPAPISHFTCTDPGLLALSHLLINSDGRESRIGITVRKVWEALDPVARDLMLHCWCSKKGSNQGRNAIARPTITKTQAQKMLTDDLCNELEYLHSVAMTYI